MKKNILLNPGPVNTSPRVQQALLKGDMCHREEEIFHLLQTIRKNVLQAFAPDGGYGIVLIPGSGTAAMESAVSSCLSPGKKMLIVNNGVYGARILTMTKSYGFSTVEVQSSWLKPPDLSKIEKHLSEDPSIEVVAMVHHETTTGLINPITRLGELVHQYQRTFLVDSVSGLGGEEIDLKKSHIQFCGGTANKCIQGFPGLSFVLIQENQVDRVLSFPKRSLYLSLSTYLQNGRSHIPFTPPVQIAYAFSEALEELLEEGVIHRISRYKDASTLLREGFKNLNLDLLLPEGLRSNTITSLKFPKGMTYKTLHDQLREKGFIIYAGQGKLESEIFRVANMGHLTQNDFKHFLNALEETLKGRS
ncbi:MAG TPA: aminotransferase class V-fold PLP-dependent enzyme [Nitrospiria bacterium]|jgi:2-aminoethylphosphonate-pyruvate transaminase